MVDRMTRALKGEVALYEQVEANPTFTQEAYTIVGIGAALYAVGTIIGTMINGGDAIAGILAGVLAGIFYFIGYLIWAFLTYFIGTRVFNGRADFGEMQRTLGYAYTPRVLEFLGPLIPFVGGIITFVLGIWSLYLGYIAVRQALDFENDNTKAILTIVIAWVVNLIISLATAGIIAAVLVLFGVGAAAVTG